MHIAVVGAGPAGALCARTLVDRGHDVVVLEKSRGPGGRMATRRRGESRYDHGAPWFSLRDRNISALAEAWKETGLIAVWQGRFGRWDGQTLHPVNLPTRWVVQPRMSALAGELLKGLDWRAEFQVDAVERGPGGWTLHGPQAIRADAVVLAVPALQAVPLLGAAPQLAAKLSTVEVDPCWAVFLDAESGPPVDAAVPTEGPLALMIREASKPGRPDSPGWVLHATASWSRQHLEDDAGSVAKALVQAAQALGLTGVTDAIAHRWRYAQVRTPVGRDFLLDGGQRIGVCGDGLLGGRVESALASGLALGARLG